MGSLQDDVVIHPFDGSLADARGLLAVEKATFDESPYDAEEVQAMLAQGPQRAWLAVAGGQVVGFVIAFLTAGLRGAWWEVDLLAVLPTWRGQHLASRLIAEAVAHGSKVARRARAVVADDNHASMRAFVRAGFHVGVEQAELFIYRPQEQPFRARTVRGIDVSQALDPAAALDRLPGDRLPAHGFAAGEELELASARPPGPAGGTREAGPTPAAWPRPILLLAQRQGRPAGHAELVEVQTLLYRGVWIEALWATTASARETLLEHAQDLARQAHLDEVGAVVPARLAAVQRSLRVAGFRSLGRFVWLACPLPPADRVSGGVEEALQSPVG